MAIPINDRKRRVDPPAINVIGREVVGEGAVEDRNMTVYSVQNEVISADGLTVTKTAEKVFYGNVTVSINPDNNYIVNSYPRPRSVSSLQFVGPASDGKNALNLYSDTYYTINGKDPSRTKSNLYTGAFVIRRNESGSDNTIIKARTYVNGKASAVRKVEIRIQRLESNQV